MSLQKKLAIPCITAVLLHILVFAYQNDTANSVWLLILFWIIPIVSMMEFYVEENFKHSIKKKRRY